MTGTRQPGGQGRRLTSRVIKRTTATARLVGVVVGVVRAVIADKDHDAKPGDLGELSRDMTSRMHSHLLMPGTILDLEESYTAEPRSRESLDPRRV